MDIGATLIKFFEVVIFFGPPFSLPMSIEKTLTTLSLSLSPPLFRRMAIDVNSSDSSYMPQRVTVQGGSVPDNVQDISTVRSCTTIDQF